MSDSITQNFAVVNPDGSVTFDFGVIADQRVQFPFGIDVEQGMTVVGGAQLNGGVLLDGGNALRINGGGQLGNYLINWGEANLAFNNTSSAATTVPHSNGAMPHVVLATTNNSNVIVSCTAKDATNITLFGRTPGGLLLTGNVAVWFAVLRAG